MPVKKSIPHIPGINFKTVKVAGSSSKSQQKIHPSDGSMRKKSGKQDDEKEVVDDKAHGSVISAYDELDSNPCRYDKEIKSEREELTKVSPSFQEMSEKGESEDKVNPIVQDL